jgi:hypothetical protein
MQQTLWLHLPRWTANWRAKQVIQSRRSNPRFKKQKK